MSYEVQTCFYNDVWEGVWVTDGLSETFNTLDDAIVAIRDHIIDCIDAVENDLMEDCPAQDSFRIVGKGNVYEWTGRAWNYAPSVEHTYFARELKHIIEIEPNSIRAAVAAEALDFGYKEIETFFADLLQYGCQSGIIGSLIYYSDTHAFYDKHYAQIEELRYELEEALGEPLKPQGDLKNWYAWLGFEETARKIADEFEIEW
jgi:hypothetical protein